MFFVAETFSGKALRLLRKIVEMTKITAEVVGDQDQSSTAIMTG